MVFHSYNYNTKILLTLLIFVSCIEKDVYEGDDHPLDHNYYGYLYPYANETHDIVAEIALILAEAPDTG